MENIKEKIFQAIGHASVCWDNKVFDSKEAEKVGDNLLIEIEKEITQAKREVLEGLRFLPLRVRMLLFSRAFLRSVARRFPSARCTRGARVAGVCLMCAMIGTACRLRDR